MSFNEATINRWLDTGILDGVPDDKVDVVVKSCEDLFDYFMSNVGVIDFPNNLDTWCFPMVRKILEKVDYEEFNVRQVPMFAMKTMGTVKYQNYNEEVSKIPIDCEPYMTDFIIEEYLKEYHGGDM